MEYNKERNDSILNALKVSAELSEENDNNDLYEVKDNYGESKLISQVGVSKIVEARLKEILKFAKNEIKNLTNREIRYIIITGGLSELAGFSYLIEEEFGSLAKVCNISTMGIQAFHYLSYLH